MNSRKSRIASLSFPTKHCPSPASLPHGIKPAMRRITTAFRESMVMPMYPLIFGRQSGSTLGQSLRLSRLFATTYGSLLLDPSFRQLPSAAALTLAPTALKEGHGFVSVPEHVDETTKAIIFLHGYGGNMLYNLWQLKTLFPTEILLLPSWSLGWPSGGQEAITRVLGYLDDFVSAVQSKFELKVPRPWLFALSGSGPIAFRIAAANPQSLQGLVAIASSAGNADGLAYPAGFPLLMISGSLDPLFSIDDARNEFHKLRERGIGVQMEEVADDHYLFLSRPQELRRIIETFRDNPINH